MVSEKQTWDKSYGKRIIVDRNLRDLVSKVRGTQINYVSNLSNTVLYKRHKINKTVDFQTQFWRSAGFVQGYRRRTESRLFALLKRMIQNYRYYVDFEQTHGFPFPAFYPENEPAKK